MKYLIIIIYVILLSCNSASAHNPNEAFFVVSIFDESVEIEAELPWSIRNALLDYRPELNEVNDKSKFEEAFFDYIQAFLVLKDGKGDDMRLIEIMTMDHEGHAHQNRFLLKYKGSQLKLIRNRIMFNIYENQVNYHKLEGNSNELIQLTIGNDRIQILQDSNKKLLFFGYLTLILAISVIIIWNINNNAKKIELKF